MRGDLPDAAPPTWDDKWDDVYECYPPNAHALSPYFNWDSDTNTMRHKGTGSGDHNSQSMFQYGMERPNRSLDDGNGHGNGGNWTSASGLGNGWYHDDH